MGDVGVEADVAHSMEEALSLLENNADSYQVALLCANIVETGVLQAVNRIREMTGETVPILVLSEHDKAGAVDLSQIENVGVLTKPFFASAFKEKIQEMKAEPKTDGEFAAEPGQSLAGLHFLAAEDNEINAEILQEILAYENAVCEIVENGELAVERFERAGEGEFDAILMDVQMPVMNGYEATKAIRALKRKDAGEIPIIAMTANAFAEDVRDALEAGMNVHLAKPIDIELLKKTVKQYVGRKD